MDKQGAAVAEIPEIKLAKVGKDRDRKRGGGGWFGGRGAGSGFSGAAGAGLEAGAEAGFELGLGAGGAGGVFGTGMSLAKLLTVLLLAGIASVGAWELGGRMMGNSSRGKPGARKLFADKDSQGQYADTSGVLKEDKSIPNSLGYITSDGLTSEERAKKLAEDEAARKAAEEEAARKAAEDAQKNANADAGKPAAEPAAEPATGTDFLKKGLTAGKFGSMGSFGGGGGLAGGSGLSGGITRNFNAIAAAKPQVGALATFKKPTRAQASSISRMPAGKSGSKGFAMRQLGNTSVASRQAVGVSKSESASSGAAEPFDNNPVAGSVISGPGLGAGTSAGSADSAPSAPTTTGGGSSPTGSVGSCQNGAVPDANGNCQAVSTPSAQNAAPYQWMIMLAYALLGIIAILAAIILICKSQPWFAPFAQALSILVGALGGVLSALGAAIMKQTGDKMMGGIMMGIGAFVSAMAFIPGALLSAPAIPALGAGAQMATASAAMTAQSAALPP